MRTTRYDLGDVVICDLCNRDYSHDQGSTGGFVFASKAVCPDCAPDFEAEIKRRNEDKYIQARAEIGEPFSDLIRRWRNGPATMTITSFDGTEEFLDHLYGEKPNDVD